MDIPGVPRFITREEWVPQAGSWHGELRPQFFTPDVPAMRLGNVTRDAVHYGGVPDVPDGDPDEIDDPFGIIKAHLTNQLTSYLLGRTSGSGYTRPAGTEGQGTMDRLWFPGYWLGYNYFYTWQGWVWEGRGIDYSSAATYMHNGYTIAHHFMIDIGDTPTDEMWSSLRAMRRWLLTKGSRAEDRPWGHREFRENTGVGTDTGCPGDPTVAGLHAGLGDLDYDPPVVIPPPPTQGGTRAVKHRRIIDTRTTGVPLRSEQPVVIVIPDKPAWAQSAFVNITTVAPTDPGHLFVDEGTSTNNYKPEFNIPNTSLVQVNDLGEFPLEAKMADPEGSVHVVIDLQGWAE